MTPERVKAIAEAAWIHPQSQPLDIAIERAITQAVNEFAEHAALKINAKCTEYAQVYALPDAYDCIEVVRALKLPEVK